MSSRRRVLFFGEPATLAHVVRPLVLARALPAALYEVAIATGPDYRHFVEREGVPVRDLWSTGTHAYLRAVAAGRVVFPFRTLDAYVREDLRHIEGFAPEIVVGDFRLSLAVSARLAKVPYVAISNAYWSPCSRAAYEMPVHPLTKRLGPALPAAAFRALRPFIIAYHSLPMHRLRRRYGMRSLGLDLRAVFTEADVTAYADVPALVPEADCGRPDRYRYIGPVLWSPAGDLPAALAQPQDDTPWVYVALGSSGDPRLVATLLAALKGLPCRVAVATAGAVPAASIPAGVVAADYLPGDAMSERAALVICNGGSPGTYQALAHGTPVLGIPANLDQMLNMHFVARSRAGAALRADRVTVDGVAALVTRMLRTHLFAAQAKKIAAACREYDAGTRFAGLLRALAS